MGEARKLQIALALAALLGGAVLALQAATPESAREIRLEARDMAFYLEGGSEPNPTLTAAPGERLRLVFVNRDRGYAHDLRLATLGVAMGQLAGDGSAGRVTFRAPAIAGEHPYDCSLHPRMMGASLVVR
ncbi:MAG: hypothetical protein ACRD0X_00965 [Thermoanaerobaculia bacterium]